MNSFAYRKRLYCTRTCNFTLTVRNPYFQMKKLFLMGIISRYAVDQVYFYESNSRKSALKIYIYFFKYTNTLIFKTVKTGKALDVSLSVSFIKRSILSRPNYQKCSIRKQFCTSLQTIVEGKQGNEIFWGFLHY